MTTEEEKKLEYICSQIGYNYIRTHGKEDFRRTIFTQEFINKYDDFLSELWYDEVIDGNWWQELGYSLNNAVYFLYNLLKKYQEERNIGNELEIDRLYK